MKRRIPKIPRREWDHFSWLSRIINIRSGKDHDHGFILSEQELCGLCGKCEHYADIDKCRRMLRAMQTNFVWWLENTYPGMTIIWDEVLGHARKSGLMPIICSKEAKYYNYWRVNPTSEQFQEKTRWRTKYGIHVIENAVEQGLVGKQTTPTGLEYAALVPRLNTMRRELLGDKRAEKRPPLLPKPPEEKGE